MVFLSLLFFSFFSSFLFPSPVVFSVLYFLYLQVNLIHFSILLHEFCTKGLRSFKFQENSRKFRELAKKRK
ncbi:hypothetical protein MSMAP_0531 [Methanosarcina mazei SarPi]|uniref:Uncharacterized protein n=1 Tax=Methanosarcina mazei SarPi TaxID=1434115 RepID=A0A0E3LRS2_METMZ|nr:hypothetical protein MSMAP_0531 [Methanosarcina mazei SarPi]